MRFIKFTILTLMPSLLFGVSTQAKSPVCYVVQFHQNDDRASHTLDSRIGVAVAMNSKVEHVKMDTSSAATWEKSAHDAFDRDIVPIFNKWIGLSGIAAVVDANSKKVLGCVNDAFTVSELAEEIRRMCARASGNAYMSRANYEFTPDSPYQYIIKTRRADKSTQCPAASSR